jgi:hypothetical protein
MSVKLNRPSKPEESQKNSNFNGKTIPYPGLEPGTSGLAVAVVHHFFVLHYYETSSDYKLNKNTLKQILSLSLIFGFGEEYDLQFH